MPRVVTACLEVDCVPALVRSRNALWDERDEELRCALPLLSPQHRPPSCQTSLGTACRTRSALALASVSICQSAKRDVLWCRQ